MYFCIKINNYFKIPQMILEENRQFIEWLDGCKKYERVYFFRVIMDRADVKYGTVLKWFKGETPIKKPYKEIINSIAGRKVFETDSL